MDGITGTKSVQRTAYQTIRQMIVSGELKPGQPVVERDLAGQMSISRAPVREALLELEKEGLIRNVGSRIRIVPEITIRDAVELYELREALEGMAARLLAESVTDEAVARLREMMESMGEGAVADEDEEIRFHEYIVRECGNARLAQLADPIRVQWVKLRFHDFLKRQEVYPAKACTSHAAIVEAIERGDGDLAESLSRRHIREAKEKLLQFALRNMESSRRSSTEMSTP